MDVDISRSERPLSQNNFRQEPVKQLTNTERLMLLNLDIFKPEFNKKVNKEVIESMEPIDWASLEINDRKQRTIKELQVDHNGVMY